MKKPNIIFDMNGVMIHDIPAHEIAWVDFARKHGVEITQEIFAQQYNGKINAEIFAGLLGRDLTADELQDYLREKELMYQKVYRPQFKPMRGLIDLVHTLHENNIRMSIGTAAPPMNVDFMFELTGLDRSYFETIVDASQVSHGKPHPEIYSTVIERMAVAPDSCIVFEDSMNGINAAKAAGAHVIALATTHGPEYLKEADIPIIKDFTEVTPQSLTQVIS